MSSFWERLRSERKSADACLACGSPSHYARDCVYYHACYVCQGRGHKSFDCPEARRRQREEAVSSAPVHYSTANTFLTTVNAQATAYVCGMNSNNNAARNGGAMRQLLDEVYDEDFRAAREYQKYAWGREPDTFQQPLYVHGLPTFELLGVFARLLPGDFAPNREINDKRREAFSTMKSGIAKILNEFGYSENAAAIDIDEQQRLMLLSDSRRPTDSTLPPNPLNFAAAGSGKKDLARALLHYAVYAEETTQLIDIVAYNEKRITVVDAGSGRFKVVKEGVGEGRPSVMRGDRILLQEGPGKPAHGGRVHFVNSDEVVFTMPWDYDVYRNPEMDLIFLLPRSQERSYHRALASAADWFLTHDLCINPTTESYLYSRFHQQLVKSTPSIEKKADETPAEEDSASDVSNTSTSLPAAALQCSNHHYPFRIPFAVHNIGLNERQSDFVAHVLSLNRRVSLLWGPPGTGKTTAVVAAIAEVVAANPSSAKILAVCPSNDASDLVVERLQRYIAYINKNETAANVSVVRVHSLSRPHKSVSEVVKSYSKPHASGGFLFPTREEVMRATIVVATMMTSDRLYGIGVDTNHFTHVFGDEVGHATEQLLALPLALGRSVCKVVLAGDPKQLGPRIRSKPLVTARLQESPLKRLMEDPTVWRACGTMLVENYRSHPAIIHVVNAFYSDLLVAASVCHGGRFRSPPDPANGVALSPSAFAASFSSAASVRYSKWSKLVNPSVPILCIDHNSPDSKEKDSPSWCNEFEVTKVIEYITSLLDEGICQPESIAVITPYTKQVQKLSDKIYWLLVNRGVLTDSRPRPPMPIRVATVDAYQGRESDVVILSCVRSTLENAAADLRFQIGFLTQPERGNVAISRARELLVVIANQELLSLDKTLAEYFSRMKALGCVRGVRSSSSNANNTEMRSDMVQAVKEMMARRLEGEDEGAGAHERVWVRHQ